jgi:hypothetical protein
MPRQTTWSNWMINHESNDAGNRNLQASGDSLSSGASNAEKLRSLVEEIDTVHLAADASRNVMILHSPKNLGGTRTRPDKKVSCMLGLGSQAVCILVNLNTALAKCNIFVPMVQELSICVTAQDVSNIPVPGEIGMVGFVGSAIFIPGPVLRNAILTSNTKDLFELIPLITKIAGEFDLAQNEKIEIL